MTGWVVFVGTAVFIRALAAPFGRFLTLEGLTRTNYAGMPIPTSYGLLLLFVSLPFYLLAYVAGEKEPTLRIVCAAVAYGLLGFADDRWGDRSVGGLKGHFRKLFRERQVTTGAVKAIGGSLAALLLAASLPGILPERIVAAMLIALASNALNLVDTRPVRTVALFFLLTGVAALTGLVGRQDLPAAWGVLPGAALAYLPVERSRKGMLGDSGSNLLGGVAGVSLAMALNLPAQMVLVVLLIGFHLFTERRSLNAFIGERPALRRIDEWVQGPAQADGSEMS